jgi:hypothetical protein
VHLERRVAILTVVVAAVVFCAVQDRVTASGVSRYIALQHAARRGGGPLPGIDEVMQPAVRRSVRDGALWSGGVAAAGLAGAAIAGRRSRRG